MQILFAKEYLRDLYEKGKADKKHRYQPHIVQKYVKVIHLMRSKDSVLDLACFNGLHYEKLQGDKKGLSSVRVSDQYRIEFEEQTIAGETVATICNITDLSNHYQ